MVIHGDKPRWNGIQHTRGFSNIPQIKTTDDAMMVWLFVVVIVVVICIYDVLHDKNKATARLATRGNSLIFHDAWFTKSWYLQGFVKT